MKEQFVTYEIALKLKELGFDEPCFSRWTHGDSQTFPNIHFRQDYKNRVISDNHQSDYWILAPLWQQVIDWFREKYHIHINICDLGLTLWSNSLWYLQTDGTQGTGVGDLGKRNYNTYEEAREQAILKAIELCQNKKS